MEFRPISAGEIPEFFASEGAAFGVGYDEATVARNSAGFEPDRSLVALDGAEVVGTSGVYSLEATVPGPEIVRAGGVSFVGVLPTHRRRGILTTFMRRHIDNIRDRGEPLALLTASEGGIYARFGFGPASNVATFELGRAGARWNRELGGSGSVRLFDESHAAEAFPLVFDHVRRERVGDVGRPRSWWEGILTDSDRGRGGVNAMFRAAHLDTSGTVDGYAIYRLARGSPDVAATVRVEELCAMDAVAEASLWAHLGDIDLTERIELLSRPLDEPMRWLLEDTRQLRLKSSTDHIWVRLVDLPLALEARRYPEGSVVLEVADEFCPWNEGRWRLSSTGAGAQVVKTSDAADLSINAADLGTTFLGAIPFAVLARAGRAVEGLSGGLARADRLFHASVLPYCATDF